MMTKRKPVQKALALTVAASLFGLLPLNAAANSSGSNKILKIKSERATDSVRVEISTEREPNYSVFRLSDPFRILIDINDAHLPEKFVAPVSFAHPAITSLATNAITDANSAIVRLEITLDARHKYEVRTEGRRIIAKIIVPKAKTKKLLQTTTFGKLIKKTKKNSVEIRSKITGNTPKPQDVEIMELENPPRVVIDIKGAKVAPKYQKLNIRSGEVRRVRIGARKEGVRLVVDLKKGPNRPEVNVDAINGELVVAVLPAPKKQAKAEKAELATKALSIDPVVIDAPVQALPAPVKSAVSSKKKVTKFTLAIIEVVRFEPKKGFVRLTVDLSKDAAVIRDSESQRAQPLLRVQNAELPEALVRKLDTTEIAKDIVDSISTFNDGKDIVIAAQIASGTEHRHWRKGNRLFWDFRTTESKTVQPQAAVRSEPAPTTARVLPYAEQVTSSYSSDAASTVGKIFSARKRYRGRRISLDLKDAELHNVLRLLADVAKLNIVASDDVSGTVTLKLRNVPWDQALDIILQSKALDKTRNGNIIRVAPLATLVAEEKERLARRESKVLLDPLSIRLIPVNYADAAGLAGQIEPLLTEQRGSVKVDARTNVLVIEDIAEVLLKVERLVRTLDTQTPQVLIESRIVEAATSFVRELGVQWGGESIYSSHYGTQTGLQFPNTVAIRGGGDDQLTATGGVRTEGNNFAVNLPAAVGTGKGGSLGFLFGSAGGSQLLNLRLSASEAQGKTKIISSPRIVTTDNTQAKILTGEKIPITVQTANGPSTRFIDANLELQVKPHVTADGL